MVYKHVPGILIQEEAKRLVNSYEAGLREDLSVKDLKVLLGAIRKNKGEVNFAS